MPIYEFFCDDCNTIFNFFSRSVNTNKKPICPKCKKKKLKRQMSVFAVAGNASEDNAPDDLPVDESRMEKAMQMLAREAGNVNEDDPKQAANLMRKLTQMTGMELGSGMEEALTRMERGDDPETIEAEMGDILEGEDPFVLSGKKGGLQVRTRKIPLKDDTLYDL
ncbi:MAG: zinc ribbon domain-containing protein [Pseudomonadota bacterium]